MKTKKYCKIPEIYPVKRPKKRNISKNEINRWTRCGKMILKKRLVTFENTNKYNFDLPVDSILLKFSLFVPFNRVNLWYFTIFFCFYFSDSYYTFKFHAWWVLSLCMTPFSLERGQHQVHPTVTVNLLLKRSQSEPCRDSKLTMHGNLNM